MTDETRPAIDKDALLGKTLDELAPAKKTKKENGGRGSKKVDQKDRLNMSLEVNKSIARR